MLIWYMFNKIQMSQGMRLSSKK